MVADHEMFLLLAAADVDTAFATFAEFNGPMDSNARANFGMKEICDSAINGGVLGSWQINPTSFIFFKPSPLCGNLCM